MVHRYTKLSTSIGLELLYNILEIVVCCRIVTVPSFNKQLPIIYVNDVISARRLVVWHTKVVMNQTF
jgi:hypothetical protein